VVTGKEDWKTGRRLEGDAQQTPWDKNLGDGGIMVLYG